MTSIFKILTLNVLFVFLAVTAHAQKNNAHIQYVFDVEASGDQAMQAAMMNGSTVDVYFAPENSKMVINMMQGMVKLDVRMDSKTEKGIMLMDMMGQQKYKTINPEDVDKEQPGSKGEMPEIKYLKEYKDIAGYKCQKALVMVEGKEPLTVYFTEDLDMPKSFQKYTEQLNMKGLKGFPMGMQMVDGETKMNIMAKAVDTSKQSKKIFDLKAPEGYTEMTDADIQQMGGMGGF